MMYYDKEYNEQFYNELLDNGYVKHHDALDVGYCSRNKDYSYQKYDGRFGVGYKFHRANADNPVQGNSRKYHWITYIIKVTK